MVSSNNQDVCIIGSDTKGQLEVRKAYQSILTLAIKNVSLATKITNPCNSWSSQPFVEQIHEMFYTCSTLLTRRSILALKVSVLYMWQSV